MEVESDGAEVQAMRIDAEVLCGLLVSVLLSPLGGVGGGFVFYGIDLLVAVA